MPDNEGVWLIHPGVPPLPPPLAVWCEKAQAKCYEQPLGQAEDAPLQPCRTCRADV